MIARKKSTIGLNIKKYLESSQNKKASLEWNDLKHVFSVIIHHFMILCSVSGQPRMIFARSLTDFRSNLV